MSNMSTNAFHNEIFSGIKVIPKSGDYYDQGHQINKFIKSIIDRKMANS